MKLVEFDFVRDAAQAEKRRESMMVGLSKTKDQLSASEERIKALQLDVQRTQMDLLAKTSEQCCCAVGISSLVLSCNRLPACSAQVLHQRIFTAGD